jgi:hypothetical protein
MTNYDRIKEMDFDEMAEFINNIIENGATEIDWELDKNGIVDDSENPWSGVEEVSLWLRLEITR